jgi:hypothetical protein
MTPDQALHSALQADLTDVLVIGYDADGGQPPRVSAVGLEAPVGQDD